MRTASQGPLITLRRSLIAAAIVIAMCVGVGGASIATASSAAANTTPVTAASIAPINDYPSQLANPPANSVWDPWFFGNRDPQSFVAWRLYQHGYWTLAGDPTWGCVAYATPTDCTLPFLSHTGLSSSAAADTVAIWYPNQPVIGVGPSAGFQIPANADPTGSGNVAWVSSVNPDGSLVVETYSWVAAGQYVVLTVDPTTQYIHIIKTEWVMPFCELFAGLTCPPGTQLSPPGGGGGTPPPVVHPPVPKNAIVGVIVSHSRRVTLRVHLLSRSRVLVGVTGPGAKVARTWRIAGGTHSATIVMSKTMRHGLYHITVRVIAAHARMVTLTRTFRI